ncbi:copper transpport protein [Dispira simplex]|nr:copper transpport protein [Dispira simplex]
MDHHHVGHDMPHDMPHDPGMHDHGCAMNMAFNWDTKNVCVLFNFWRIQSVESLLVTCLLVVVLSVGYEFSKKLLRRWEWHTLRAGYSSHSRDGRRAGGRSPTRTGEGGGGISTPGWTNEDDSDDIEENTRLAQSRLSRDSDTMVRVHGRAERHLGTKRYRRTRAIRAFFYSLQVFYSFLLMLIFMTYNCYLVISVVIGAAIGHFFFAPDDMAGFRSMSCH